jgi:hypothetical protein
LNVRSFFHRRESPDLTAAKAEELLAGLRKGQDTSTFDLNAELAKVRLDQQSHRRETMHTESLWDRTNTETQQARDRERESHRLFDIALGRDPNRLSDWDLD